MPDSHINPPFSPPKAGKKWFPATNANGDDIGTGYSIARCVRGQFYNVQATKSILENDKILVRKTGTILTDPDSELWPFINTYRPLTNPTLYIGLPPMKSFVLANELEEDFSIRTSLSYSMKLPNITFKLGCLTIEYSLSFDPYDDSIFGFITNPEHIVKIFAYRQGNATALNDFPFNEYPLISLLLDGKQFNPDNGTKPLTLSLTGIHKEVSKNGVSTTSYPQEVKKNLLTGTSLTGLARPSSDNLKFAFNDEYLNCTSLRFRIKKIWIFRAFNETNLNPKNLPCSILGYAVTLRKVIEPEKNTYFVTFPKGDNYRPTVNLKLFDPEYRTNSPGFAHGVNLRFYFASVPITGAFDIFGGLGLETPFTAYQFTLLGIQAGKRQARYIFFEDTKLKKEKPLSQYLKLNKVATLSKNESFSIKQSIDQEPGIIDFDQEIAVFKAVDETSPVFLKKGINFSKGLFRASFKTQTINNFNNNNYHVYFRMWFAPKETYDVNNLLAFRSQTEICFQSDETSTKLVRKSPTRYDEVLIGPPSPVNLTQYEIGRYISDKQIISMPEASFDEAVLVVGVYVRASGKKVTGTVVNFAFDTEKNGFDTPIYQVISKELHAIRNPSETSFTSNSYLKVADTYKVSSSMTGRRPIPITYEKESDFSKDYEYIPYKNKFISYAGADNSYAFEDVVLLKKPDDFEDYDKGKLNIPISEELFRTLSKVTSPNKLIVTDFVTETVSLQNGRINNGSWQIEVKRNTFLERSIDFELIIEGTVSWARREEGRPDLIGTAPGAVAVTLLTTAFKTEEFTGDWVFVFATLFEGDGLFLGGVVFATFDFATTLTTGFFTATSALRGTGFLGMGFLTATCFFAAGLAFDGGDFFAETSAFFTADFLSGFAFLTGFAMAFFATTFLATTFLAITFLSGVFLAITFFATVFFTATFLGVGFFASAFLAIGFLATAFFMATFLGAGFFAITFFTGAAFALALTLTGAALVLALDFFLSITFPVFAFTTCLLAETGCAC
jgi:hypothetical protein